MNFHYLFLVPCFLSFQLSCSGREIAFSVPGTSRLCWRGGEYLSGCQNSDLCEANSQIGQKNCSFCRGRVYFLTNEYGTCEAAFSFFQRSHKSFGLLLQRKYKIISLQIYHLLLVQIGTLLLLTFWWLNIRIYPYISCYNMIYKNIQSLASGGIKDIILIRPILYISRKKTPCT